MKNSRRLALVLACFSASLLPARGADPAPPSLPAVPASLAVPSGQAPSLVLTAKGVQIYEGRPVAGETDKFEWAFKAPEADLFDAAGKKVGKHYAGPTWELIPGSKVVGKVKAKADAPDGKGIPWLLLDVVAQDGAGMMAKMQSIQRVATVGGKAPVEAVDRSKVGQERRVEYSATYVFYVAQR